MLYYIVLYTLNVMKYFEFESSSWDPLFCFLFDQ